MPTPTISDYEHILTHVFAARHQGSRAFDFDREELVTAAVALGLARPKNIGDILYTFRYRKPLPASITTTAPAGREWVIRPRGIGRYRFALVRAWTLTPNLDFAEIKIPDATPGVIASYALNDEQALLARLRYNRLIDIFTGVTCYSLQNHLRTAVSDLGQVETDEVYIGLDRQGAHYVIPVQAKAGRDRLNRVQIEQDFALCAEKFPNLICRPLGAQFTPDGRIVLFEFKQQGDEIRVCSEKHYRLAPPDQITSEDLAAYRLPAS